MSHADIRVGDIGTVFRLTIVDEVEDVVNISAATTTEIRFQKPDETSVDQDAAFTTDGVDGEIQYVTIADDLDVSGKWKIQAYIVTPVGEWRSEIETFWVQENLA
jgi:hypothetical protein